MVRRSLPVSATPQPGEVLESWLGTLAARLDMTFSEFLFGVGLPIGGGIDLRPSGSIGVSHQSGGGRGRRLDRSGDGTASRQIVGKIRLAHQPDKTAIDRVPRRPAQSAG